MSECVHCYVSGLVQGVFFRAATRDQAQRLDLTGWVRNLHDGRVEVLACGDRAQLEALVEWLHEGPPHANVSAVEVEWRESDEDHVDFEVR